MKVLLDANILMSMLLSKDSDSPIAVIANSIATRMFTPVASEVTFAEMSNSIRKKRYLANRIGPEDVLMLRGIIEDFGHIVPSPTSTPTSVLRDPKDDYLIWTARKNNIDILVSGDDDVLAHAGHEPFAILSPPAFVAALEVLTAE